MSVHHQLPSWHRVQEWAQCHVRLLYRWLARALEIRKAVEIIFRGQCGNLKTAGAGSVQLMFCIRIVHYEVRLLTSSEPCKIHMMLAIANKNTQTIGFKYLFQYLHTRYV